MLSPVACALEPSLGLAVFNIPTIIANNQYLSNTPDTAPVGRPNRYFLGIVATAMANLATNRKAHFRYEFLDRYQAGIELFGYEVKACKAGKVTLEGSRAIVRGGEAYLVGANIAPYQANNVPETYDPARTRRLLLKKAEIASLATELDKKGLTAVPLSIYAKNGIVKIELALARGKKGPDKRQTIRKRDDEREAARALRGRGK